MRHTLSTSLLVLVAITVMLQARVESTRWWSSPSVVRMLRLSPAQCAELDRIYEGTLPARLRLAEQITALADRVQQLNDSDASDEEVMPATEQLTHAQAERGALKASLLEAIDGVL